MILSEQRLCWQDEISSVRRRPSLGIRNHHHLLNLFPRDMLKRAPISTILSEMLHAAGAEPLTLDWLLGRMGERSFGLVLLLLSVFGLLPGVSAFVAVLLMVPAIQMLLARSGPVFPRGIRGRRFEARRLAALLRYVIPALRWLERFVRPRWTTPAEVTKRVVGGIVFLLSAGLLAPVPLSNVPPALAIMLIAFAYLEGDGVLLCGALVIAFVMVGVVLLAAWETMSAAGWLPGLL